MAYPELPVHLREGEFIAPLTPTQDKLTPQLEDYSVPKYFWDDLVGAQPIRGIEINEHHIYFNRRAYTTRLERDFRMLPENRRDLPLLAHQYYHRNFIAPVKPPVDVMVEIVVDALCLADDQAERFVRRRYGITK